MAAISLTQLDGFIQLYSIQGNKRTVVSLREGADGQAQFCCLEMPAHLNYSSERDLRAWYMRTKGYDAAPIIKRFCRMPGTGEGDDPLGEANSPHDELSDIHKVRQRCLSCLTNVAFARV